jgi:hypothetical protein
MKNNNVIAFPSRRRRPENRRCPMMRTVTLKELFFEELNRQLQAEGVRVVPSEPPTKVIEPTETERPVRLFSERRQDDAA